MRILTDANVLFAAAIGAQGRSALLFLLAEQGWCELLASPHAVAGARRNLEARYPDAVGRLEHLLRIASVVSEAPSSAVLWARRQGLPEEDAPILAAATTARADVLVTGDRKHFGPFFNRAVGSVKVLSLADTLNLLLKGKRRR